MNRILEARDLEIYKRLLRILAEYDKRSPAQGINRLFNQIAEAGKKVMPKDKHALHILDKLLDEEKSADTVQKLMNIRFCSLPTGCRPLTKEGNRHLVAFWKRGDHLSDRVKDLIDWEGDGGSGKWTSIDGESVTLIDMSKEEK